jgi:glucan phosphoethanolaminetransferase (alkaline phosphatase superfamily)
MSEGSPLRALIRLGAFAVLPLGAVMLLVVWGSVESTDGALIRFANALLTSFTFVSFILLLTLFVYGDARKRPLAPLLGMLMSVLLGVAMTVFFLSQGELLMENNGSVRAQALSNLIRLATTVLGMGLAVMAVAGTLFASLMNTPPRVIQFEEE